MKAIRQDTPDDCANQADRGGAGWNSVHGQISHDTMEVFRPTD
jgi:hypothetical protein